MEKNKVGVFYPDNMLRAARKDELIQMRGVLQFQAQSLTKQIQLVELELQALDTLEVLEKLERGEIELRPEQK